MTEKEITELETEVLAGEDIPKAFELEHLTRTLSELTDQSRRLQINFRLFKYTRDDEKMKSCGADLKKLRDMIEGVSKRLDELRS